MAESTRQRVEVAGASVDVAIIGAGITGLSIAYNAALRGLAPVVFERAGIAAEASGVQPGGVRQQWSTDANCLLARESYHFYRELSERLESRVRPVLDPCGYVFVAHSQDALQRLESSVALQNGHGIPSRILSPAEVGEIVPGFRHEEIVGASYCPEDGYFDRPQSVVEVFAEAAFRTGASLEHAEVTALRPNGGGWELELADGRRATAAQVVVATGYETNRLLAGLGVELPIRKLPKYLFYSDQIHDRLLEPLVVSQELHFAAKHLADGRVLASDLGAAGDPTSERERWRANVRSAIQRLLPQLEYVSFPLLIEGFYDATPDSQAIVGALDGLEGVWLAVGFSGHGFMMAPAVGRAVAALLCGEAEDGPIGQLQPERFAEKRLSVETQIV